MNSRTPFRVLAFAAAAGLLGVACGGSSDDAVGTPTDQSSLPAPDSTNEAATDTSPTPAPNGDAPEILQFSNALVGGGELDATTLAGKPTAFWFWAPT